MFHALTNLPSALRPPAVCGPLALRPSSPTNLVPSSDFVTGWLSSNTNVLTGVADPDGGTNAVDFQSTTTASVARRRYLAVNPVAAAAQMSFSVSVKAGQATWARLQAFSAANWNVYFDIVLGTVGTSTGTATGAFITPLGGGWFRIGVTATSDGTGNTVPGLAGAQADANATFAGTAGVAYLTAYNPVLTSP